MRRRALGQHFLVDEPVMERLVYYGEISRKDVVLEVGAGTGELTRRLAERAGRVIAVELDESLAAEAISKLKDYDNVELLIGDVLKLKPKGFNKVVSNPPYSISTKLMEWLIESLPQRMVLTLQREFASKLSARPGSRKYLFTSFVAQLLYEVKIAEVVPRKCFRPIPKVDSAIVVMSRRSAGKPLRAEEKRALKFLFTRRRQTLRRVVRDYVKQAGVELRDIIDVLSPDLLAKRVYQLKPEELLRCSDTLIRLKGAKNTHE